MIKVKKISLILTIIFTILLPFTIAKSVNTFLLTLFMLIVSMLIYKITIFIMKQKILDDEYKKRR